MGSLMHAEFNIKRKKSHKIHANEFCNLYKTVKQALTNYMSMHDNKEIVTKAYLYMYLCIW